MKKLFFIFSMVFSVTSMANTIDSVFKSDSVVPQVLQEKILNSVKEKCSVVVSDYGLSEIETTKRKVKIDQGMIDIFYSSTLSSRFLMDGVHPTTVFITVESSELAFSNGDNTDVLQINCI